MASVRIVGAGRAGGSFALALGDVGWDVELVLRGVPLAGAGRDVDLVLLCVPDAVVAEVASSIEPVAGDDPSGAVIAHCAGSLALDVLVPHPRRASVHPLAALPSPPIGAARLRGAWFGVAGDPIAGRVVADLGGRAVEPDEGRRAEYHAAAVVASNHVVALLGQLERIAADLGVPAAAYLDLARSAVDDVADLGAAAALTGPVARGDWDTVRAHLAALPDDERATYVALARAAARLAGRDVPDL